MSRRHLALAVSITGAVIVALDGTALTVAQPSMQRDLDAPFTAIQWTTTGYLIAVASLLVFAGRLGDRYGHRRVFAVGILGFAAASMAIVFADGIGEIIGLRVLQGIFGALLQPATLGMLRAAYPPDRLGMPIALRTSAIGLAVAGGPLIGGALTAHFGWRSVFVISAVPALAAGILALAVRITAESPVPQRIRLDLPGACLLALALAGLVHTLVGIPDGGWTTATSLGLALTTVAIIAFTWYEKRAADPLIPRSLLRSPSVTASLGILTLASAAMLGALFLGSYFLQTALDLDPLHSALLVLPLAVMMVLGAPISAALMRRFGPRRTAGAGMALLTLGLALMSRLGTDSSAPAISACCLLLGAGFAPVMVTATAVIVRDVPTGASGVAGGLQQTAMNVGPALGTAATTMLLAVISPDIAGPQWTPAAFATAMGPTLLVLAAVAAIGAVLTVKLPTHNTTVPAGEPSASKVAP